LSRLGHQRRIGIAGQSRQRTTDNSR
jgi:hypothetical protein